MGRQGSTNNFGSVAVLMGGDSSEREVSLMSGQQVVTALLNAGVNAYGIDVDIGVVSKLMSSRPDRAFVVLHGTNGEDGVIQGMLDMLAIPYTGSGVAASALTMNKWLSTLFFRSINLPVLPTKVLNPQSSLAEIVADFDLPVCVKPAASGSSCGVTKVQKLDQLFQAYENAKQFSHEVIIEPWITGREFTVAIIGEEALPIVEIVATDGFYDYQAKYISDKTQYHCPCDLTKLQQAELQSLALRAFKATGCQHWGRVDFIQDSSGKFWLTEINTIPGMTAHSLVPMAAREYGMTMEQLVVRILEFTLN